MTRCEDVGPWVGRPRAETMLKSEEVEAMLHLHALGWGMRRIAKELGCSRNTVRRYVAADGWMSYGRRAGGGKLEDEEGWLKERFLRHRGNAEVVRQDLVRERSIEVSLRNGGAGGGAVPAAADGGGEGDGAVRDASRASAAD